MRQIYLDYNATTPLGPGVMEAMMPYLKNRFGNASSLHQAGQKARYAVEQARESIAGSIGARIEEIFFTSGGTEANNLALWGIARTAMGKSKRHLMVSAIEHPSVLGPVRELAHSDGFRLTSIPVSNEGVIDLGYLSDHLQSDTAVVSIMHVNHETGVIQPLKEVRALLRSRDILFHVDASQSLGKISFNVKDFECDFATLSSHKIYGPKGVGALYIRKGVALKALFHGGHQEKNIRPGTENVPAIVGFGKAAEFILSHSTKEAHRLSRLKERFKLGLTRCLDGLRFNGAEVNTIPSTLNVCFEAISSDTLVMNLDLEGICVSTGSACTAGSVEPSHVLLAMGLKPELARSSVRFSMGYYTTEDEVDTCTALIPSIVKRLRKAIVYAD